MIDLSELEFNGTTYPTAEAARVARRHHDEAQRRLRDGEQRRRDRQERDLRDRFLAAGGSEQEWQAEKADLLREARKAAVLADDDAARGANQLRYR